MTHFLFQHTIFTCRSGTYGSVDKVTNERRSRVASQQKEREEHARYRDGDISGRKLSFDQLGISPQHLRVGSYEDSGNEADDERALYV